MAEVTFENVSKVYASGVHALRGLTLHVRDGEFLVLVGPSGSGKTTTLRLLAGLEKLTSGSLAIGGRRVNDLPPRERDVALVFQRHTLYPHLTVRRNLSFGLMLQRSGRRASLGLLQRWRTRREENQEDQEMAGRIAEAAHVLQLEDVLDCKPEQLSGGQQQRVALGRAFVRRPAVFLLDEPLSHLDAPLRSGLRRQLHLLHKRFPATMIYVTHDPVEAMILADRVAILHQGVVQQVDRPLTVYQKPCNRFVAGFFGWPSMNLLDGQLQAFEDGIGFVTPEGVLPVRGMLPAAWRAYLNKAVTVGVRPHDLTLTDDCSLGGLAMTVTVVEALGNMTLAVLQRGRLQLTAQVDSRLRMNEEQTFGVVIPLEHVHLFDPETGRVVANGRPDG